MAESECSARPARDSRARALQRALLKAGKTSDRHSTRAPDGTPHARRHDFHNFRLSNVSDELSARRRGAFAPSA
ncbi:hypothetical protein EVAR_43792_1 [Eumeta japonica]|uniref:Uncharacterized protein n=1 Tax=Eumeta variegata TaxID=151549 RepID=A0A4C1XTR4_EUMVA|nr:hypothetical protein EVAR_43792_1 [Eumeta japonica]